MVTSQRKSVRRLCPGLQLQEGGGSVGTDVSYPVAASIPRIVYTIFKFTWHLSSSFYPHPLSLLIVVRKLVSYLKAERQEWFWLCSHPTSEGQRAQPYFLQMLSKSWCPGRIRLPGWAWDLVSKGMQPSGPWSALPGSTHRPSPWTWLCKKLLQLGNFHWTLLDDVSHHMFW